MHSISFDSQLGAMALTVEGPVLRALVFGYRSERAALRAVRRSLVGELWIDNDPSDKALVLDDLVSRLQSFAEGEPTDFSDVQVEDNYLTTFQRRVRQACRKIPWGETRTYGQLAAAVGRPGAARAVGSVMSSNRIPLVVPCHRVVPASGGLGGFSAPEGIAMKRRLLLAEQALVGV